jgi:hypothetical protein
MIGSPKGKLIQFTFRLSKGQAQVIENVAREEGMTISEVMRNVITESITDGYLGRKFKLEIVAGAGPLPRKKRK